MIKYKRDFASNGKNLRSEAWWKFISLHFSLITHYSITQSVGGIYFIFNEKVPVPETEEDSDDVYDESEEDSDTNSSSDSDSDSDSPEEEVDKQLIF